MFQTRKIKWDKYTAGQWALTGSMTCFKVVIGHDDELHKQVISRFLHIYWVLFLINAVETA